MPSDEVIAAEAALIAALSGPQSVSGDAGSVTNRSVKDLIEAANYLRGIDAARSPNRGLRFSRMVPDGTVDGRRRCRRFNGWPFD